MNKTRLDSLSLGKRRRLRRLSDADGRFAMLAIDQRGSLRRMLARQHQIAQEDCAPGDLGLIKRVVTAALAPLATAVLTDPLYGYPASADVIPRDVGVLLAVERTGYRAHGAGERRSRLLAEDGVQQTLRHGADAVKLLIYHHPEVSADTQRHQQEIVEEVGQACAEAEMPFVLEVVTYTLDEQEKGAALASEKPALVADAARTYSASRFGVDLLKLEFPAELKYTEEYQETSYGAGTAVYDRAAVAVACSNVDAVSEAPWVILSAGVDPEEFIENLKLANRAGASGFLCGRAVWKHVVDHFPDEARMKDHMEQAGRRHFRALREANTEARPWYRHPRFRDATPESATAAS